MSGIPLIFPAFFGAGAGPLLSLGLSFVPPPYGIASSGIMVAASIVLMTVSCSNARSGAQKVEGSKVLPVFFFFTSVIALAVLFVGWIFARIFNDEVGKIVSIAISSVLLLISLICVCNNSSCCSNDHEPKRRSQTTNGGHTSAKDLRKEKIRQYSNKQLPSVPAKNEAIHEDRGSGYSSSVSLPVETCCNVTQEENGSYIAFLKYLLDGNLVASVNFDNVEDHGDKNDSDVEMARDSDMQQISVVAKDHESYLELRQKDDKEKKGRAVLENPDSSIGRDNDGTDNDVDIEMSVDYDTQQNHESDLETFKGQDKEQI